MAGMTDQLRTFGHALGCTCQKCRPRPCCNNCSGRGGFYDRANGERYLSDPEDGTPWQQCPECEGTGFEP
jgi:hypothetical protein